jgi:hypothetical protein
MPPVPVLRIDLDMVPFSLGDTTIDCTAKEVEALDQIVQSGWTLGFVLVATLAVQYQTAETESTSALLISLIGSLITTRVDERQTAPRAASPATRPIRMPCVR